MSMYVCMYVMMVLEPAGLLLVVFVVFHCCSHPMHAPTCNLTMLGCYAVLQMTVEAVHVGHFMTSLDMAGCSITLLRVDGHMLELLREETTAAAWPRTNINALEMQAKTPQRLPVLPTRGCLNQR